MRSAPVGLFRRFDPKQAFELGARSAAITHGHPSGYLSAGMVSAIVRYLMDGMDIHAATEESLQILKGWDGYEETLHAVTKALDWRSPPPRIIRRSIHSIGGGWVGEEALAIALYAVLAAKSYVEAVRIASNHDGDSDSTASIAGQFWGRMERLDGDSPRMDYEAGCVRSRPATCAGDVGQFFLGLNGGPDSQVPRSDPYATILSMGIHGETVMAPIEIITLPSEKYRLEEINLPGQLAESSRREDRADRNRS